MNVRGFNHIAIQTHDLPASILFYRDVLGFAQQETVDAGGFSSTNLVFPGGFVELVCMHETAEPCGDRLGETVHHIAFDVEDVDAAERSLRLAGVEMVQSSTTLVEFKSKVAKCMDPNGVVLAFRQDLR